jgi:hypothetical protein
MKMNIVAREPENMPLAEALVIMLGNPSIRVQVSLDFPTGLLVELMQIARAENSTLERVILHYLRASEELSNRAASLAATQEAKHCWLSK